MGDAVQLLYSLIVACYTYLVQQLHHCHVNAGGLDNERCLFQGQLVGDAGPHEIWYFISPAPAFSLR